MKDKPKKVILRKPIEKKAKKCDGINKAKDFKGCGIETFYLTNGLCDSCLIDFYFNDERGKIIYAKLKGSLHHKKEKAFKTDLKQKLKTNADYVKELQKEVNTIVRLIDKGTQCISTLKPLNSKYDAGHFYSCGSNPSLRFHLDNIHAQSVYANQYLSGDQTNYLNGLETIYGTEYRNMVLALKEKHPILKLSIHELREKITIAKEIVKELKSKDTIYKPFERMIARDIYNTKLGIYN